MSGMLDFTWCAYLVKNKKAPADENPRCFRITGLRFRMCALCYSFKSYSQEQTGDSHWGHISFFYDTNLASLSGIYTYIKNLQGDVLRVVDESGSTVLSYAYDPWGVPTVTGNQILAELNPCSYRGYYYDWETGYYYLQSRYYDATNGRFLNADDFTCIDYGSSCVGCNLFAYCENNAACCCDPTGFFVVRRWMVSAVIDFLLSLIPGLAMAVAPVKTLAKQYAGAALKQNLKSPLTKLLQFVVQHATKLLNGVKSAIVSLGAIGRWIASKINVAKLVAKLAGLTSSVIINKLLNLIVPNIDIFLSVGGVVSGILDFAFDKLLNNCIWEF